MNRSLATITALLLGAGMHAPINVPCSIADCAELTENLIADGGMEEWQETPPTSAGWEYLAVRHKNTALAKNDKGNILTPKAFSQFAGCSLMKPEGADVHGGRTALRLRGQFYLRPSSPDAYRTQEGDTYVIRYWAKGRGQTLIHVHVYGDAITQIVETRGKAQQEKWSLIEERIQVVGRAPTSIYPRLWTSEEMLIDDVFVGRILRDDERKPIEVPADCQERIAFASPAKGAITVDGKLEEPAWSKAIRFRGFRLRGDQALLATASTCFRVLFDEQNLYFGFETPLADCRQVLEELQNSPLRNKEGRPVNKTDTYADRESIEVFLQAPGKSRYCQFVVSLDGYRYDGAGMDRSWNGTWESGIGVGPDRWFLEMKIPLKDLGVDSAPAEGWKLNVCSNRRSELSTWAAVGSNFHNPYAFGNLVAKDFLQWSRERRSLWVASRAQILKDAEAVGRSYSQRLAAMDAFPLATSPDVSRATDWEAVTRAYARMSFMDYGYRCIEEEIRYLGFFR